jgi:hypothetical protein
MAKTFKSFLTMSLSNGEKKIKNFGNRGKSPGGWWQLGSASDVAE